MSQTIVLAQTQQATLREVRTLLTSEWDVAYPAGIAYSAQLMQLQLVNKNRSPNPPVAGIDVVSITPYERLVGSSHLDFALNNSINMAYSDEGSRLFLYNQQNGVLAQVKIGEDNVFDPSTLLRFDTAWLGLRNPQGMSIDATKQQLYLLDAWGPRLAKINLKAGSGIDDSFVQFFNLSALGITAPRGLAVHPLNGHLFIGVPAQHQIYEISETLEVLAIYDTTALNLVDPQGFVLAPSADLTDPPNTIHLYIADSNLPDEPPTPVPTAVTATPIATAPTQTPIATAPTQTPIATAPTQTPIATAPTQTPIATAPTQTPIATAPTQTPIATAPTQTPIATAPTQTPIATKPDENFPGINGQYYFPLMTNSQPAATADVTAAPVFGRVVEAELEY